MRNYYFIIELSKVLIKLQTENEYIFLRVIDSSCLELTHLSRPTKLLKKTIKEDFKGKAIETQKKRKNISLP